MNENIYKVLNYGRGEAEGYLSVESVKIGELLVPNQEFILISHDEDLQGMAADGILGMGFPELSDMSLPLVYTMFKENIIETPLFSVYLSNNEFGQANESLKSNVIFGGFDEKTYAKGNIDYIPLIYTGYWSVKLDKISLDDEDINSNTQLAILDTGSSLILGPELEINKILTKLSSGQSCYYDNGLLVCSCNSKSQFPSIEFRLDGKNFVVMPEEYLIFEKKYCIFLLSSIDINVWILGDVFLRSYYTVYDMENMKIGIARSITASDLKSKNLFLTGFLYFILILAILAAGYFGLLKYQKWKNRMNSESQRSNHGGYVSMTSFN